MVEWSIDYRSVYFEDNTLLLIGCGRENRFSERYSIVPVGAGNRMHNGLMECSCEIIVGVFEAVVVTTILCADETDVSERCCEGEGGSDVRNDLTRRREVVYSE
jgi:hypothetical protein